MNDPDAAPAQALVTTPFGRRLFIACEGEAVVASAFTARRTLARPALGRLAREPVLREAVAQVEAYCGKRLRRFDVPLRLEGTALQLAIWEAVATLDFGATCSYADIARAVGRPRAHRAVAAALARTPLALFVPAHRVVGADGSVKGAQRGGMRLRLHRFEGHATRQ